MSNCQVPGPTCSAEQLKKSSPITRDPVGISFFNIPSIVHTIGNGASKVGNAFIKKLENSLGKFGITDIGGFMRLQASYEKPNGGHGQGLRVALGRWQGKPCMYEFKTNSTGYGQRNMVYTSTLDQQIPPIFLTGTQRECYLTGDIILVKKYTKSKLLKRFSGPVQDKRSGALKFLSYLLNEGEQKEYDTGYWIVKIEPNADGSGAVTLQPVIFIGGAPIPSDHEILMGIGGIYHLRQHKTSPDFDLPKLWAEHEIHNSDVKKVVLAFSTTVAKYGVGGVKHIGFKLFKKIVAKKIEKEVKSKIRQVFAIGTAKALASFMTTFIKELEPHISQKTLGKYSRQIIEKALLKSVGSALASFFSEIGGKGLENLIPKEVVEGITKRITRVIIGKYIQILEVSITKLFDLKADEIDLKKGKITRTSVTTANNNYKAELKKVFTDVAKEAENSLIDFALGL
jgi:hypothetical protein